MHAERARVAPEAVCAAALAAAVAAVLGGMWVRGLSPFWSDLTYLHHGWRAAPAMLIQAGRAPLWEPSLYFGMPMAGAMQGGIFYPAGVVYSLFGFATATALFQFAQLFTAGWLCALWLRSWRASWGASLGGAVLFAFGGVMITRLSFPNHLATLVWAPALALFFRRPPLLALTLGIMALAGYPTFIPGCAAAAWVVAYAARARAWTWRSAAAGWALAASSSAGLAALQLLPGLELAFNSRRAAGVGLEEALIWSFAPRDLLQWIGPLAVGLKNFHPAVDWTMCVYLGLVGAGTAAWGAYVLPRRRAVVLLSALAAIAVLILGSSNPVSAALWAGASPLRFVRYPGNLSYIALLPLSALATGGFSRRRFGPVLVIAAGIELVALSRLAIPAAPRELFVSAGPLVRTLQAQTPDARYLISPKALHASTGSDVFDWKHRLYGLTNAPYRLRAAVNFGEPLVPSRSYAVLDALESLPNAEAAGRWMPWLGAARLLTPGPASWPSLEPAGAALWSLSRPRGPVSLAWRLSPAAGAALPAGWPATPPPLGTPLELRREREDRFEASGAGEGWAFVAEPLFPGWRADLNGKPAVAEPALEAFQKIATPPGPWTIRWRYDPAPWKAGLLLSWAAWTLLAAYWYHRA